MNTRGFTVMEMAVGIVAAGVLAIVSAALFKAGILVYNYTARQNTVLRAAANTLGGDGVREGVLTAAREASSVSGLSSTTFIAVSTSGATTTFSLSGTTLQRTVAGVTQAHATGVSAVTFNYYNLNSSTGLIMESTAAVSASMVTALVTVNGIGVERSYSFFSGARLRNHQ